MHTLSFLQGPLGQISPNPTTFLLMRLPTLDHHIKRLQLPRHLWPKALKMGRSNQKATADQDGGFTTAPLKEYPPLLNQAIAHAIADTLCDAPVADGAPQEDEFMQQHAAKVHTSTEMGPDYVPPDANHGNNASKHAVLQARADAKKDKVYYAEHLANITTLTGPPKATASQAVLSA